jgi:hypothetical protein
VAAVRQIRCALQLSACLFVALCAPAAAAPSRAVPPNNSAIDQFLTTTPGAAGDERLARGEEAVPGPLRRRERRRLAALGPRGDRALALLEESSPAGASRGSGRPAIEGGEAPASRSPVAAVASAVAGNGRDGLGLVLPGILIAAVAVAGAARLHRRTTRAGAHEGPQPGVSNTT